MADSQRPAKQSQLAIMKSCIYEGWVRHRRHAPVKNHFRVKLCLMLLDLDELDQVFAGRLLWSTRRPAIARFRRRDYFGPPHQDLRESVAELIAAQGGNFSGGPVRLLTHLRYWGFGFNPVSFYYCYSKDAPEQLEYIIAEVTNTPWGQKHAYVLNPAQFDPQRPERLTKDFHVSPFMPMEMEYQFRLTNPAESLLVHMANLTDDSRPFDVTMKLERRPLTTYQLTRVLWRYPLMTLQVVGHIYYQAWRLWWKRVPFVPHPAPGQPHGNLAEPWTPISQKIAVNSASNKRLFADDIGEAESEQEPELLAK
jgi:uncharacterized protein